ncbi:hypothetical protein AALA78_05115 [Lachnospiraceae bacterium 42-17]
MDYIKKKYPALLSLYQDIYNRGNRSYWEALDTEFKITPPKSVLIM